VRFLRAVLFSVLPLLLLLVVLELLFWALGMGDPQQQLSLTRGFDDRARYFVPEQGRPGAWRTQMFDQPKDEVHVPPRDDRKRVLLFGGSNCRLFSADDLQAQLDAAAPGRRHEVINLGRPGYGSERELILLRQALVALEPDVVVVYCGHNEFVEAGFASELAQEWKEPWVHRAALLAQRLRTINVLVGLLRAEPTPTADGPPPEPRVERSETFSLYPEQTQIYYDQYRENLRAMCRETERHGTGLVLGTVVGNMLSPPVVPRHNASVSAEARREFNILHEKAHELVPERLVKGLIRLGADRPPLRLHWHEWNEHMLQSDLYERKQQSPREAPVLRPLLPPLDGAPLWTDPAGWEPVVFDVLSTVSAFHARDLTPEEREGVAGALDAARRAVAISPDYALEVFELGLYEYLAGDTAAAVEHLHESENLDCTPNRGNDITNDIVREVAAEHPQAVLVDADALFQQRSPEGLVGYEIVMDNCHLHPGARHVLMADFVPAIEKLLPP